MNQQILRLLSGILFVGVVLSGTATGQPDQPVLPGPRVVPALWPDVDPAKMASLARPLSLQVTQAITIPVGAIVFESLRENNWDIYRAEGAGNQPIRLTTDPANDHNAGLNHDSTRVAFASNREGNDEIYVINADGTDERRLTQTNLWESRPQWSPDGLRIVYQSTPNHMHYNIFVMNGDGSNVTQLTNREGFDGLPKWSPDGSRIIFTTDRAGGRNLWTMKADGSDPKPLTSNRRSAELGAWSPDGKLIAFDDDGDGDGWQELWVMNADGSAPRVLYQPLSLKTDALAGAWSPDGKWFAYTEVFYDENLGRLVYKAALIRAVSLENGAVIDLVTTGFNWWPDWQARSITRSESVYFPLLTRNLQPGG